MQAEACEASAEVSGHTAKQPARQACCCRTARSHTCVALEQLALLAAQRPSQHHHRCPLGSRHHSLKLPLVQILQAAVAVTASAGGGELEAAHGAHVRLPWCCALKVAACKCDVQLRNSCTSVQCAVRPPECFPSGRQQTRRRLDRAGGKKRERGIKEKGSGLVYGMTRTAAHKAANCKYS